MDSISYTGFEIVTGYKPLLSAAHAFTALLVCGCRGGGGLNCGRRRERLDTRDSRMEGTHPSRWGGGTSMMT